MATATEQRYAELRELLPRLGINIEHSTENFNALINVFYGTAVNGEWNEEHLVRHFSVYRNEDGSIQVQAQIDINQALIAMGMEEHANFSLEREQNAWATFRPPAENVQAVDAPGSVTIDDQPISPISPPDTSLPDPTPPETTVGDISGEPPLLVPEPGEIPVVPVETDGVATEEPLTGGLVEDTGTISPEGEGPPVNENEEAAAPGVLQGGQLIQVVRPGRDDLFVMMYGSPPGSGQFVYFEFENLQQVLDTFGVTNLNVAAISKTVMQEQDFVQIAQLAGDATEIIGLTGGWTNMWNDTIRDSLTAAGIADPTTLGLFLNDPEVQTIMGQAALTSPSAAQLLAAFRKTSFWRNTLYPGIDFFYNRGDTEPESAWIAYRNDVQNSLALLGVNRDPDGTFKSSISQMLSQGVDANMFNTMAPTFLRATNSQHFFDVLNQWSQEITGQAIEFGEWFDVLQGATPPRLQEVVETATLQFAADQAGSNLTAQQIRDIASETDLTEQEAINAFTDVERQLLAIGDRDLAPFGITRQDFLDVAVRKRPTSGFTAAKVASIGAQLAIERGISDDVTSRPFLDFRQRGARTGAPVRPGLQALTGVSG